MRRIVICWVTILTAFTGVGITSRVVASDFVSPCVIDKGGQIDVVVLLDQSLSLAPLEDSNDLDGPRSTDVLAQLADGLGKVAAVLEEVVRKESTVSLGVIEFSTYAQTTRELSNFRSKDELLLLRSDLLDTSDLGNSTDYVRALEAAADMFSRSAASPDCRILIWFTDGVFELLPRSDESGGVRNQEYVNRTVNKLRNDVCIGTDSQPSIADRLHTLGVTTYALMISDEVETWLAPATPESSSLEMSKSIRFQISLDAMQAVTGDSSPELGGVDVPSVDPDCGVFVSGTEGGRGPDVPGKLVASSGTLAGYLQMAIRIATGGTPVGECPSEIDSQSNWESQLLPPGNKFESLSISTLEGEIREVKVVVGENERPITLNSDSGTIATEELQSISSSWRLKLVPSGNVESTKFCVTYVLKPLRTTSLTLTPKDSSWSSSSAAVGESEITVDIDWSDLIELDGLDPKTYLESVVITSPVGDVQVSDDFSEAVISISRMPDNTLGPDIQQKLDDQFDVVLTPKSDLIQEHLLNGRIDPPIALRNNENQPSLLCDGADDDILKLRGDTDGEVHQSERTCVVAAPKSGVARLEVNSTIPDDRDRSLAWFAVDGDGSELPSVVELRPGDGSLEIKFSTQQLDKSRGWIGNGQGSLTLTWDENESTQTATFGFDVDVKKPIKPGTTLWLIILMLVLNALLSLLLLWVIGRLLIRIPKGSKFYLRRVQLQISTSGGSDRESRNYKPFKDAVDKAKLVPVRDARRRSTLEFEGFTLSPHVPIFPPFRTPVLKVSPPDHVAAVPNGSDTATVFLPFSGLVLLKAVGSSNDRGTETVSINAYFLYPAGTTNIDPLLKPLAKRIGDSLDVLATDYMKQQAPHVGRGAKPDPQPGEPEADKKAPPRPGGKGGRVRGKTGGSNQPTQNGQTSPRGRGRDRSAASRTRQERGGRGGRQRD